MLVQLYVMFFCGIIFSPMLAKYLSQKCILIPHLLFIRFNCLAIIVRQILAHSVSTRRSRGWGTPHPASGRWLGGWESEETLSEWDTPGLAVMSLAVSSAWLFSVLLAHALFLLFLFLQLPTFLPSSHSRHLAAVTQNAYGHSS